MISAIVGAINILYGLKIHPHNLVSSLHVYLNTNKIHIMYINCYYSNIIDGDVVRI